MGTSTHWDIIAGKSVKGYIDIIAINGNNRIFGDPEGLVMNIFFDV